MKLLHMKLLRIRLMTLLAYTPTVNEGEARNLFSGFMTPLTSFLLFGIPPLTVVAGMVAGWRYFQLTEEEREQRPLGKSLTSIVKWAIVLYAFPVILRVFGLY